jgi:teichuronic acid biosynthesis glycosyltransferase TuaC
MLRVLWLTTEYPWSEDPVGGIFHRTAARSLVTAGVRVVVASPTPTAPWPLPRIRERWRRYSKAPTDEVDRGVEVLRPRYLGFPGDPSWARSDARIAKVARGILAANPDIQLIHAHYPAPMGMAAWRLARATGLPYLVTHHGSDEIWRETHPSRMGAYRRALHSAARVLAVSESLKEELATVADVDSTVLPIGVDLARFATTGAARHEARNELGIPPEQTVVVLVATLVPAKGIRPFVDAVIGLGRPFLALIVGEGSELGYRAADGSDVIRYTGAIPNDLIPRYLAAADMLILPSETEGLPTVLVEAGAAGVPTIASAVGGIPELLGSDRGFLLGTVSAETIASALTTVARDRDGATARADRLRRFVLEHYDATQNGVRLASLYQAVLDEHDRGRRR